MEEMKKILVAIAAVLVLSVSAYAAWMTNINHKIQVRIPDGWNTEYQVMVKKDTGQQAHIIMAKDKEKAPDMVAAIVSMDVRKDLDLKLFKAFFEKRIVRNATVVEETERYFNNLPGIFVTYDAKMGPKDFRLMCFFTKKDPYFYAVFTGTEKAKFDERKSELDQVLVTFRYTGK